MSLTKKKAEKSKSIEPIIPDKLYFRIGEVAELCELPTYVLRFWETEFPQLRPTKSSTGQRMYRRRDVDSVLRIRKLLYEEGFTIAGARQHLRDEARAATAHQTALPFPTRHTS
jgi:DNA-binding transcriptional MerR regulator